MLSSIQLLILVYTESVISHHLISEIFLHNQLLQSTPQLLISDSSISQGPSSSCDSFSVQIVKFAFQYWQQDLLLILFVPESVSLHHVKGI